MKPLVTLIDGALPAREFSRLRDAIVALGTERLRDSYQTTFWFDFDDAPTNLVEDAALTLRARVPAKARGVEWWLSRMRTSNVKVDFHRDHDIARKERDGVERNPLMGSVLYLNECRGGLLAVTREPPNPRNPAFAPTKHDFDFVAPRANRYTFFNGKLTHGVLDAENQIPGKRLPREPELRLAIAINFWKSRPLNVPKYSERNLYAGLRGARE